MDWGTLLWCAETKQCVSFSAVVPSPTEHSFCISKLFFVDFLAIYSHVNTFPCPDEYNLYLLDLHCNLNIHISYFKKEQALNNFGDVTYCFSLTLNRLCTMSVFLSSWHYLVFQLRKVIICLFQFADFFSSISDMTVKVIWPCQDFSPINCLSATHII